MDGSDDHWRLPPKKEATFAERCLAVLGCGVIICASPLILCFQRFYNSPVHTDNNRKRAAKPPEPVRRKRALSICPSSEDSNLRKPKHTAQQSESGFFKLSVELRNAIYDEVVGRDEIHIVMLDGRLCSYPCLGPQAHDCAHASHIRHCWIMSCHPQRGAVTRFYQPGIGIMGALQSCRRVYSEMVPLIYSKPRFLFGDPASLLAFSATILPQRFNTIRSVHIDQCCGQRYWPPLFFSSFVDYRSIRHLDILGAPFPKASQRPEDMILLRLVCEVLCGMKALRELRLDLIFDNLHYKQDTVEEQNKATFDDVNSVIMMLDRRNFKTLEISFDRLAPEAAGWTDLPFVRLRPQLVRSRENSTAN